MPDETGTSLSPGSRDNEGVTATAGVMLCFQPSLEAGMAVLAWQSPADASCFEMEDTALQLHLALKPVW